MNLRTAISLPAGRVSFAAAAAFLVLLASLHVLKPELDPSWRMGSEYAIGDYGWVMRIAFCSMALSCVGLCAALHSEIETIGGRIALGLLLVVAAALVVGGIFVVDPVTTKPEDMTTLGVIRARLVERMVEPVDGAELLRMADDRLMAGNSIAQECGVKSATTGRSRSKLLDASNHYR